MTNEIEVLGYWDGKGWKQARSVVSRGGVIPNPMRGNGERMELRMDNGIKLAGSVNRYGFSQADDIYSVKGISPTILAHLQGQTGHAIQIAYEERVQKQNHLPE